MTIVSARESHQKAKFRVKTVSSETQEETELECQPYFVDFASLPQSQLQHLRECGLLHEDLVNVRLIADRHIQYLQQTWDTEQNLRPSFVSLDASRPWMLYWTLHGCDLLNHTPSDHDCLLILNTLKACWTNATPTSGGFGGGPTQMPHAATTYAAVLALCILASDHSTGKPYAKQALEYLDSIREPLFAWMMTLREPDAASSGFSVRMQHDGEIDVRASYCVVAVAKLLGILRPSLTEGLAQYVISCQTYEGGFGGEPWSEAHGGYTFCAIAALYLLGHFNPDSKSSTGNQQLDIESLTQWLTSRQMAYEGGFSGRSNKLVDGCYSFWQGGAVAIVSAVHSSPPSSKVGTATEPEDPWLSGTVDQDALLMDEGMLERYILLCAQDVTGGLRDKPSKRRDFYHTCYNLSGLSVVQQCSGVSFGHPTQSRVAQTHPCYNIRLDRVKAILEHYRSIINK